MRTCPKLYLKQLTTTPWIVPVTPRVKSPTLGNTSTHNLRIAECEHQDLDLQGFVKLWLPNVKYMKNCNSTTKAHITSFLNGKRIYADISPKKIYT